MIQIQQDDNWTKAIYAIVAFLAGGSQFSAFLEHKFMDSFFIPTHCHHEKFVVQC